MGYSLRRKLDSINPEDIHPWVKDGDGGMAFWLRHSNEPRNLRIHSMDGTVLSFDRSPTREDLDETMSKFKVLTGPLLQMIHEAIQRLEVNPEEDGI